METVHFVFAAVSLIVLLTVTAGMVRIIRGPTAADRMLAALMFGTSGVAILLMLAEVMALPALTDVALVFVVLALVASVAFVRLSWNPNPRRMEARSE